MSVRAAKAATRKENALDWTQQHQSVAKTNTNVQATEMKIRDPDENRHIWSKESERQDPRLAGNARLERAVEVILASLRTEPQVVHSMANKRSGPIWFSGIRQLL